MKKGFKARLYRTAISVWTQYDFGYKYLSYGRFELEASADLDMNGIDFVLTLTNRSEIALQIKKETYRSEARERGRFAKREIRSEVEIPYTLSSPEDLERKLSRARKEETRRRYECLLYLARTLQKRLENGFIVFNETYVTKLEEIFTSFSSSHIPKRLTWYELIASLMGR